MNDDSADPVEPTPLVRAREMIEEWAAYADEYFREKWDLAGDLAEIDRAIEAEARASAEKPAVLSEAVEALAVAVRRLWPRGYTIEADRLADLAALLDSLPEGWHLTRADQP
jgi:hypothetical protein